MFYYYYYLAISCCNYLAKYCLNGFTAVLGFVLSACWGSQKEGSFAKPLLDSRVGSCPVVRGGQPPSSQPWAALLGATHTESKGAVVGAALPSRGRVRTVHC